MPKDIRPRVTKLMGRLRNWPDVSGIKALSGELAGRYRMRTGAYRVQFTARRDGDDWIVIVEKIGHRDGFMASEGTMIGFASIQTLTLNRIEQAKRSPSLATFDKVHRALEAGEAELAKAAGKGKRTKRK